MRKIFNSFAIMGLLAGSMLLGSCQKEYNATVPDGAENPPNSLRGTFKCYINGEFYQAEVQTARITEIDGVRSLSITGIDYDDTRRKDDFRSVTLNINYYEGPKEYPISFSTGAMYVRSYTDEDMTTMMHTPADPEALIIIKEDGTNVTGTFNFKIKQSPTSPEELVITGGEFDIPKI